MARFVIHNHLPRRARDAGRAVSREEEERNREVAYRQTGITRDGRFTQEHLRKAEELLDKAKQAYADAPMGMQKATRKKDVEEAEKWLAKVRKDVGVSDALDPRYLNWIEALKKSNQAKQAYEKASRTNDPKRDALYAKYQRLDAEQQRLSSEGWENTSTSIIGGRR